MHMANKVDPNKNDNTYNPDTPYEQKPESLAKSKRKSRNR
jgi:hypothetical protein